MSTTLERPVTGTIAPTPRPDERSFDERLREAITADVNATTITPPEIAPVAPSPEPKKVVVPADVPRPYHDSYRQVANIMGEQAAQDWWAACNCSGPRSSFIYGRGR